MTPLAEARLLGRAVRRFDIPQEKIAEVLDALHTIAVDVKVKPSARVSAASAFLAAEGMNQKDEHKLLSIIGENAKSNADGNRFLDQAKRLGIAADSCGIQPNRATVDSGSVVRSNDTDCR